ncbi:MAG: hypothetical protein J7L73_08955 [Anaerolineales bacterium]|nr:hypothetical protein [Anaerolineales bacterium]
MSSGLYLGIAILIESFLAIGLVLADAILLFIYIKFLEEKEMVARFGDAYLAYKQQTPFIIPRLRRKC